MADAMHGRIAVDGDRGLTAGTEGSSLHQGGVRKVELVTPRGWASAQALQCNASLSPPQLAALFAMASTAPVWLFLR